MPGAVTKSSSRHIHCGISHPDDGDPVSKLVAFWISQIIQPKVDIAETLALDTEASRFLRSGADENAGISVTEKLIDHQHRTDSGVGSDCNAHFLHAGLKAVKIAFRKAELRDAVLQQPADLSFPLKYSNRITLPRKADGCSHSRRSAADDGNTLISLFRLCDDHPVKIHI